VLPLLLSFCGGGGERTEGEGEDAIVLARAGESVLTLSELDEMVPADYRGSYGVAEKRELVKRWVETELIYQEAMRMGIDREPEIDSKVAEFRRLLLENELLERELSAKIEITTEDIETFYRENPDLFVREKDEVGLSQIVVDSLELAMGLRERLESEPELFGELADEHSRGRISKGGEVGYYAIDEIVEPLGEAARSLRVGEISPVVSVPGYGYFIIRVTDQKPAGTMKEFDAVKNEIRDMLLVSREEEAREKWVKELMEQSDMEVNWQLLEEHDSE
jgi:peptidyl-prolyl cis-trans isomerase C